MSLPRASASMLASAPEVQSGTGCQLARDLWRVTAGNPSPLTAAGTNSYILGEDNLFVIDPGPDDPAHLARIVATVAGRPVTAILLTHAHRDHSDGAAALAAALSAPVWAFGPARAGRSAQMTALVEAGAVREGGGTDYDFVPDRVLADGDRISSGTETVEVIHTPGHLSHHICLKWRDMVFTGDHLMGWTSTVVVPPDGDMRQYMESLEKICVNASGCCGLPGHGDVVADLPTRARDLKAHRQARAQQIFRCLTYKPRTLEELTRQAYQDVEPALLPYAKQSCLSQILAFVGEGTALLDEDFRIRLSL